MNIRSNNIRIFPTSKRTAGEKGTNWITEYNLASIVNRLVDRNAFLISTTFQLQDEIYSPIEFNINGYYVKADVSELLNSDSGKEKTALYASIEINTKEQVDSSSQGQLAADGNYYKDIEDSSYFSLQGVDSSDFCSMVSFDFEVPTSEFQLLLLERPTKDDAWELCKTSMLMYNASRVASVLNGSDKATSYLDEQVAEHHTRITTNKTDIANHKADDSNPHSVTKAQVGLGRVVDAPMDSYPGQSSENYISSKGVWNAIRKLGVPSESILETKTAFNKDFETSGAVYKANESQGKAGTSTKVARADHVHPSDSTKVNNETFTSHTNDQGNPHRVTQAQVGLGSVVNAAQSDTYKTVSTATSNKYFNQQGAYNLYQDVVSMDNQAKAEANAYTNNEIDKLRQEIAGGSVTANVAIDDGDLAILLGYANFYFAINGSQLQASISLPASSTNLVSALTNLGHTSVSTARSISNCSYDGNAYIGGFIYTDGGFIYLTRYGNVDAEWPVGTISAFRKL